ncbi:ABC transporter substrate-binding protein [Rathayibacter sp. Leaf296]|uniref:ABC transporter substrate-binding protein n=1 Tax=Rathayibacter sp. Leaf296 TaxID=1736327 RepID=UPI000703072F|nr:ABC transporter substrate-binding protein [Rathayibacter sp. Leaf296]KQQ07592.1 sugar-binding protein [Rathayibacter sp. Leaf296]
MKRIHSAAAIALSAVLLAGCATAAGGSDPSDVDPSGDVVPREISWLLSRPIDGPTISIMEDLADEYAADHPGFALNLITTPDRPSYVQKYETLAAANKLPELFDTDATPYAKKLADQGRMMDAEALLKDLGLYDSYRPNALDYQRFDDGSLRMIPFEFQLEYFWYNKALFEQAGASIPTSLDDFPALCTQLREAGITPIALDGQDQWPLERYMAFQPFRLAGPDYVQGVKTGETSLSDEVGTKAVQWLSDLGAAGCFDEGFSSTGYSDAQSTFTSGTAAMYNIGTWELGNLATDSLDAGVRDDVDFFTLPTVADSATEPNEYVVSSGIGMAVNAKTYDPLVRDFLKFALEKYPALYAATGALSPTTDVETTVPANATPLYQKALDQADDLGSALAMPWDTQLDPASNTRLQQELVLLIQGNATPQEFTDTVDSTIAENAPKFFG